MKRAILNQYTLLSVIMAAASSTYAQNKPSTGQLPAATPVVQPVVPNPSINFIRVLIPKGPSGDTAFIQSQNRTPVEINQSTQYMDGLGRPLQGVVKGVSPQQHDLVTTVVYNEDGKQQYSYLPYAQYDGNMSDGRFKADPFGSQNTFYNNADLNPGFKDDKILYGQQLFEASPLSRVLQTYAPGNSWAKEGGSHPVKNQYMVNLQTDSVRIWNVSTSYPISPGLYAAGELFKNITTDEAGHQVIEFKDKEGRLILKKVQSSDAPDIYNTHANWLCTYYVYDDLGRVSMVIPPLAVGLLNRSNNWTITEGVANSLCYLNQYDSRNRVVVKKIPGSGAVHMVYDTRDRLVFSQDEVQRKKSPNEWMVVYYDAYDRANMTGIYKSGKSRSDLQTDMNAIGAQVNLIPYASPYSADLTISSYDGRSAYIASRSIEFVPGFTTSDNSNFVAYIDNTTGGNIIELQSINPVPNINAADITPLTYIYYDDYGFTGQSAFSNAEAVNLNAGSNPYAEAFPTANSKMTKGLITGSRVRVIGTDKWLTTTNYYDDKARIVQLIADNAVGGKDVLTSQYDFSGKVLSTFHRHSNPKSTVTPQMTILTMNSYDHAGRLLTAVQQLNGDAANQVTIASNTYNELGEIREKRLGILPDGRQLDVMKYTYNVRGWLSGINPAYVNGIGSSDNWFGEEVSYDQGFAEQQFNSNLSGVKWKSRADGTPRAYGLKYDNTGRLTTADFTQQTNGAAEWTQDKVDFSVSGLSYDENGNIQKMIQKGMIGTSSRIIDNMTYSYDPAGSNKLNAVSDNVNTASAKLGDFIDGNKSDVDYTYDANGNLVEDRNKGISKITYNHLNQPTLIEVTGKGTIAYQYDANGQKLNKTVKDNSDPGAPVVRTTDYIGGFIYELDTLKQINFQDGRIRPIVKQGEPVRYTYDYFEKDHLGNVRVVLGTLADSSIYAATMEMNNAEKENALFNNIENTRVVLPAGYPADPTTNPNSAVARLNSQGQKIGPSIVLRVMAGDTIRAAVKAFYKSVGNNTSDATPASMLSALAQAFSNTVITEGPHAGISGNTGIESAFTEAEYNQVMTRDPYNFDPGKPRAYLSYVFFDDMFNLVDDNSGFKQVSGAPDELKSLVTNRMVAKKSGYLYIYVSNESADYVYFDNMIVVHNQGPLLEETHYYPFGLTMEGISRKGLRGPAYINNRNKFNGIEHTTELDMNQYDAYFRTLDPQIGRWWQIDPKPSDWESPYVAMGNNPFRYSDFLGDTLIPTGEGVGDLQAKLDNGTGGYFKSNILDNGAVVFEPTGKEGKMSDEQNAFYSQMNSIFTDKKKVSIEFVKSDPDVVVGSYEQGKIDMDDVDKFAGGKIISPYSMLAHEITEQQGKQKKHLKYDPAHKLGAKAETPITGFERNLKYEIHDLFEDVSGPTGVVVFEYKKNGTATKVVLRIKNGNIVNVIENAK